MADLRPLLAPRSIALVGASAQNAYATRLLANLEASGFAGPIHLVNPRQDRLGDRPCYPSLAALPGAVDLAAVVVPQRAVLAVLEECGQAGIPAALVITAGFGEAGDDGRAAQAGIREVADRYGLLVCGPNCLGFANAVAPAIVHASSSQSVRRGDIALVSQSGAMAFASVLAPGTDRGVGFSHVVSSGNEAVLDTIDYLRFFVDDPDTRVIASLLEGVRPGRGRAFLEVADAADGAGKPIIVCKVGRSEMGTRQVVSHTGSMTGSDAVYDAVFEQKGVIRVPDPDDLFEVGSVFSRCPPPRGEGLAVLTTSGGLGVLLADKCGTTGIPLPPLTPAITRALTDTGALLVLGDLVNPVDIRGQGSERLPDLLRPFIDDDRYHVLTVAFGLPAVGERSGRIARDLIRAASETDKPLLVLWTGTRLGPGGRVSDDDGFRLLERSGNVPVFYSPEKYFRALQAFLAYHRRRRRRAGHRAVAAPAFAGTSGAHPGAARPADTARVGVASTTRDAGSLPAIDAAGARRFLQGRQGTLDEVDARRLLAFYGIPGPRETLIGGERGGDGQAGLDRAERVVAAARALGFPVALKVASPDVPHKSDAGGVCLGVADEAGVRAAHAAIEASVRARHPGATIHGMLVQEMVTGAREMIVGATIDPQFGPVVSCGLGGVFVEVLGDVMRRVAPIDADDAREMLAGLRGARLLQGLRGRAPADVPALVEVIQRLARMVLDLEDRIAEVEMNPLMVGDEGTGVRAVDALVVVRPEAAP